MQTIAGYTADEIKRAIAFYDQSPDGQYDNLAADILRVVLAELEAQG